MVKDLKLTAKIYKQGKFYIAECVEVGVASQGKTEKEAMKNLKEATELYIDELISKI